VIRCTLFVDDARTHPIRTQGEFSLLHLQLLVTGSSIWAQRRSAIFSSMRSNAMRRGNQLPEYPRYREKAD
jgi:hypothetical protein